MIHLHHHAVHVELALALELFMMRGLDFEDFISHQLHCTRTPDKAISHPIGGNELTDGESIYWSGGGEGLN